MRTHRPIGKWPRVPLRTFQRRVGRAFILTVLAIPVLAIGFGFWAASDPPLGNGGTPFDHWPETLEAAALVALAAWAVFIILFGIARWIMTGEAPGDRSIEGPLLERLLARLRVRPQGESNPPHRELEEARDDRPRHL